MLVWQKTTFPRPDSCLTEYNITLALAWQKTTSPWRLPVRRHHYTDNCLTADNVTLTLAWQKTTLPWRLPDRRQHYPDNCLTEDNITLALAWQKTTWAWHLPDRRHHLPDTWLTDDTLIRHLTDNINYLDFVKYVRNVDIFNWEPKRVWCFFCTCSVIITFYWKNFLNIWQCIALNVFSTWIII